MSKRPPVAKSELEVAQIVWQLGEASVRQVLESLPLFQHLIHDQGLTPRELDQLRTMLAEQEKT